MSRRKHYTVEEATQIFESPFMDLLYRAHTTHKECFPDNKIQASSLLSIKTGKCPEDCSYCSQSSHYGSTQVQYVTKDEVYAHALRAKKNGATRFCMGAAGRAPQGDDIEFICECIKMIKELGLQSCATLGMLTKEDAHVLAEAGLDYYNHNVDTSPEYYTQVITTRSFDDRIATIQIVQEAGIRVCSGGILGLGETNSDRIHMLTVLANLPLPPQSIPINKLVPIAHTPLKEGSYVDPFDFIRTIALARILMPTSYVRLSAGRSSMEDTMQALCFFAGANSIFIGDTLLTTANTDVMQDRILLQRLNLTLEE